MYGIGKINIRFKPKPKRGFPCGAVLFFLAVLLFVMTFLFSQTWARYSIVLPCIRAALGTMGYLREWINTPFMFQFPELQQSVQISRDSKGINFIEASCIEDAMFAQGYVHAAEHIIRMERERRIGYGTLAEIEGVGALLSDRAARTLDLGTLSARDWDSESERARSLLESYSSGVNAYLRSSRLLPIELYLMGMTSIAPWAGADSLLLMRVHALALHSTWERTLMEDVLRLNLDKDVAEEYIQALETSARWAQGVGAIVGAAQSSNAWAKAHEDGSVTLDAQAITPVIVLVAFDLLT
jgi:acyl-homoserine lactone acylase PvdQ